MERLRDAIYYQLNERVSFIKPENDIVALLLFELGNLCILTADVENAILNYKMAKSYGYENPVMDSRLAKYEAMQGELEAKYEEDGAEYSFDPLPLILSISGGLIILAGAFFFIRRKRRNR